MRAEENGKERKADPEPFTRERSRFGSSSGVIRGRGEAARKKPPKKKREERTSFLLGALG